MKASLVFVLALCSTLFAVTARAQENNSGEEGGFRKDNLFTGGSIALGFSNNSFQTGISPVFGYSLACWVDAGISLNYNYTSFRNLYINLPDDKIRRSTYGGGVFGRIYQVNFLFAHLQFEHNFVTEKYIPGGGGTTSKNKVEANSMLVGIGYSSERYPHSGRPFFYLSLLVDVLNDEFSPYSSATGNIRPFFRAGVQVPLFQGGR